MGDGLVLRRATAADGEAVAELNAGLHPWPETGLPNRQIAAWTRDLFGGGHPTAGPDDFLVVEEAATGRVRLHALPDPQTWAYDGIPFTVGQPELVGTLPAYRRRG